MEENSAGDRKLKTADKIHRYCFPIYLILCSFGLIVSISFWPVIWNPESYVYGFSSIFIHPLASLFGALGGILRQFSESPLCSFYGNHSVNHINIWIYLEPVIGAIFGLLSFLMSHVIVDRYVSSHYELDPIAISIIAFLFGFYSKQILKCLSKRKSFSY